MPDVLEVFAFLVFKTIVKTRFNLLLCPLLFVYRNVKNAINGNKIIPLFFCMHNFSFTFLVDRKKCFYITENPSFVILKKKKKR
jgi:hypothetical protein